MTQATLAMSASARSDSASSIKEIDEAVAVLSDHATEFARLAPGKKAILLRECLPRLIDCADDWVLAGCHAKGLSLQYRGEEWIAGPGFTARFIRLFSESLETISERGRPLAGYGNYTDDNGRYYIELFPATTFDKILFMGFSGQIIMQPGLGRDEAIRRQAPFYQQQDPNGSIALVLGAGNVASLPPGDFLTKMFVEGSVVLLKMNPVNEWVGPFLEHVFAPLIDRGFLRVVYGGADVGDYLVHHETIDSVHITGSDLTHDMIVWGPPGPERERRMAQNDPRCDKPITSELGNVSPVAIVPYQYSDAQLLYQAQHIVTMVTNNASFNCNSAKMLITSSKWPQRERFLDILGREFARTPTRKAYYPGAFDRYKESIGDREGVQKFGHAGEGELPWTFISGVDTNNPNEPLCQVEAFCGVLAETTIDTDEPVEFLARSVDIMNNKLWGTLNACIIIHPKLESNAVVGKALDQAILDLQYGTVAINVWPAVGYGLGVFPWGGYQSSSLKDIQSGIGWVHNPLMFEGVEKVVVRAPIIIKPKPVWFWDNTKGANVGPLLLKMEMNPSWGKLPGILLKSVL
jgi:acyl-CoA reductase-like NAD-dependent aldehyde dehydrogenase